MKVIKIIEPGLLTTIQDNGRSGYQQFGMPVGGAMDIFSMQLANWLVGNHRFEAALEATLMGPKIEFNDTQRIAITGGNLLPQINGSNVSNYTQLKVKKGDVLSFRGPVSGARTYIAINGGFKIPEVMGSKSTYLRAALGGYHGRQLVHGDIIQLNNTKLPNKRTLPEEFIKENYDTTIRVILGPDQEMFTNQGIVTFLSRNYKITHQSDRMGYRLDGEKIEHSDKADIISSGLQLGTIQVPADGQPIIMMADRQTTGGYARIANAITVDIPKLAQLKPGDEVTFSKVPAQYAQQLYRQRELKLRDLFMNQGKTIWQKLMTHR